MLETTNPGTTPSHHPVNVFQFKDRVATIIHGISATQDEKNHLEKILFQFIETLISNSYAVTPRHANHIIEQRIPSHTEFQNILEEIGTRAILAGDAEEFLRTMNNNPNIFMRVNYIRNNPELQAAIREKIQEEEESLWNTDFLWKFLKE